MLSLITSMALTTLVIKNSLFLEPFYLLENKER